MTMNYILVTLVVYACVCVCEKGDISHDSV